MTHPRKRPATLIIIVLLVGAGIGLWLRSLRMHYELSVNAALRAERLAEERRGPTGRCATWIPEKDRRELYRLWRSLDQAVADALPDSEDDAREVRRYLFAGRLAETPIGGRDELEWLELDAIVAEDERAGW